MKPTTEETEERMPICNGNHAANRSKLTDTDPDLIGSVRYEGRVLRSLLEARATGRRIQD